MMNDAASARGVAMAAPQVGRIFYVTSIYDHVGKAYHCPAFVPNAGMAVRAFANAANDKTHLIGMNPGDYTMFVLGEWNEETGHYRQYEQQQSLGLAAGFVKRTKVYTTEDPRFMSDRPVPPLPLTKE